MNALAKTAAAAAHAQTYAEIDVDDISPSPLNHRKAFNGIDELGADIKANGLRVPIKVRPTPGAKTPYQLVYGERRWRAAKAAQVERLPALIRDLNDTEVIEEQLVENIGRDDVHPLEEADGYKQLIDKHGYDVDGIAAKTGKSKAYVYARLKLCEIAAPAARTAFSDGKINASIALLAARIPVPKLQAEFVKRVLEGEHDDQLVDGQWQRIERPLTYREAQLLAQQEYMLRLENAPFPIVDDKLVKGVGSCVGCLYRTGNQRELFDDVKSADVCTNPPCFQKKKDAQAQRDLAAWAKEGKKTLSPKEAAEAFQERGDSGEYFLGWGSTYADAQGKADWEVDRKQRSWSQLFGGDDKVPAIYAIDPSGKQWALVDKKKAKAALQKLGVLKEKKSSSSSSRSVTPGKPKAPTESELVEARAFKKILEALADKAEPKLAKGDTAAWTFLARWIVEFSHMGEGCRPLSALADLKAGNYYGVGFGELEKKLFPKNASAEQLRRLALIGAFADHIGSDSSTKNFDKVCKPFAVDYKKITLAAADEVKAELAKAKEEQPAKKKGKGGK